VGTHRPGAAQIVLIAWRTSKNLRRKVGYFCTISFFRFVHSAHNTQCVDRCSKSGWITTPTQKM
jgi:hypothetical protein